jgi:hypothetical protein
MAGIEKLISGAQTGADRAALNLGIESPGQPVWTSKEILLLGKRPDREIARGTGRSATAVQMKRLSLGIPCFRAWSPVGSENSIAAELEPIREIAGSSVVTKSGPAGA